MTPKRPQGRPAKPSSEKQSKRVQVLVTSDELRMIKTRAKNHTVSAFLRDVILKALAE
jgi:hypothetical protein